MTTSVTTSLDLKDSQQKVWLLKVPKELANVWKNAGEGTKLGELHQFHGQTKTTVSLDVDVSLLEKDYAEKKEFVISQYETKSLPTDGLGLLGTEEFIVKEDGELEQVTKENAIKALFDKRSKELQARVLGRASSCLQCSAAKDTEEFKYFNEAKRAKLKQNAKVTVVKQDGVQKLRRAADASVITTVMSEIKQRAPAAAVRRMLFDCFRKNEYYLLRSLLEITNQPKDHLMSILKEIAVQETAGSYRNYYHLKPEFRNGD